MKRSATSELPRQDFGDAAGASGNARMSYPGTRTNPPVPVFGGAAAVAASVSKDDSRCADASRRAPRTDLSLRSRAMRTAANVRPFFQNTGGPHVRFARPATLYSGGKISRDDARHRGLS